MSHPSLEEQFKNQVVYIADHLRSDSHLESSLKLSPVQHDFLQHLFNCQLLQAEWTEALQKLTKFIFSLTNQQTIILINEYNTPMSQVLEHGYLEQVTTPAHHHLKFILTFISSFKDIFQPLLKVSHPFKSFVSWI